MREERRARRRERQDDNDDDQREDEQDDLPLDSMYSDPVEAQVRKRIEKRIKERNAFFTHLISFICVNGVLWAIWGSSSGDGFPWPMFVTFFWGIGLLSNALQVYQHSGAVTARRENAIRREIELEKQRLGIATDSFEKPKRDRMMRLSDDGELVPADEDEDGFQKAKRS